jgi:LysM repeat protein
LKDKLHLSKEGYQLQAKLFMLAFLGQLKPSRDLGPIETDVFERVKLLVRKAVVSDTAQPDSIIIRPQEKIVKKSKFHRVKKGDTFYSIAARYHMNVDALIEDNRRYKSKKLQIGDRIRIK